MEHTEVGTLDAYIGQQIKDLRGKQTLREMSLKTGFSIGFLSQVERGLTPASLRSYEIICFALGTTVPELLSPLIKNQEPLPQYILELIEAAKLLPQEQVEQFTKIMRMLT